MEKLQLSEITNSSLLVRDKVRLYVERGDITDCRVNVLVHFTNSDVDLSQTSISHALLEKGGSDFKTACAKLPVLEAGDIAVTQGCRLKCREVIHCNSPVSSSERERKRKYQDTITKCLMRTAASRNKSICIPCGSSDTEHLDIDPVAKWIIEAVHDHCELHARSPLRSVRVVIPVKDRAARQNCDDIMFGLMPSRIPDRHLSEVTSTAMVIGSRVKLSIVKGDISRSQDEVIVNSTSETMDLSRGKVGSVLARKAGPGLQKACTALAPLPVGNIAMTDGFNMHCKIIHCNLPAYEDETKTKPKVKDMVNKCLKQVATNLCTSISFPAIGTGNLAYPAELVARWMIDAVIDYCDMFARSSLTRVNIVVYSSDTKTAEGFDAYMSGQVYKEVTDGHLLIYNRVHFDLIWQELTTSIEDSVVVHAARDMATIAVEGVAGSELSEARQRIVPLSEGSVESTGAFDMPCKEILFYNCARWDNDNEQAVQSVIKSCLVKSALNGYRSIAFPPVGMSLEGFPATVVCDSMVSAIADYAEATPYSSLVTVKLYMPLEQTTVLQREDCKWSLRLRGCTKLTDGYSFIHGTKLTVVKGDLADTKADFILNSTGSHMSLSGGKISLALLNKAGKALQEECDKHKPIITGDIVMTEGFGLPCKNVLHVCCPKVWMASGETEQRLRDLIMRCLSWADDCKAESLALPAMGTGLLKYPPQSVARCVVHAVADFARKNRKSQLKNVSLVLFHSDAETIEGVEEALGLEISGQEINAPQDTTTTLKDGKIVVDLPTPWQNPVHEYKEFSVVQGTREWQDVHRDFVKTLARPKAVIIEILRIQNPQTYPLYDVMRKSVARKLNKQEHEVETAPLWHGTNEKCVAKITKTKFDRSQSGSTNRLGAGTYFSTSANYSTGNGFSPANTAGERFIILARVITGESCLGNANLTTASLYKPNSFELYDSAVDNIANPSMYAVFHDASAYPEYVIKYKY